MPLIRSAKKALRQSLKRQQHSKTVKSATRKSVRKVRTTPTAETLKTAFSALDKAVKKHIMKKNTSNRLKSRLSRLVNHSGK